MKKTIIAMVILLSAATTTIAQDSTHKSSQHKQHKMNATKKYTCSMHPEVVMNKPGECPKCGMALVPMKKKTVKKTKTMDGMKM